MSIPSSVSMLVVGHEAPVRTVSFLEQYRDLLEFDGDAWDAIERVGKDPAGSIP